MGFQNEANCNHSSILSDDLSLFEEYESNVRSYCRQFSAIFSKGSGSYIFDKHGRRYLDFFSGAGALNYGHNDPIMAEKVVGYIQAGGLIHGLDMYSEAKANFIERFANRILKPRGLNYKIQFCGPTGTNAVEAALKLSRLKTKRTGLLSFMGGFHGMSMGALSATADKFSRAGQESNLSQTTFVPFPEGPRGPFDSISYITNLLEDSKSGVELPSCVIVESIQSEGGVYCSSPAFLQQLRALCDQWEILLILDEIQVGCGRTGTFFSFEEAGIQPDIVVMSKSLSGFGLPFSLVLLKDELDIWEPGQHNGTFRGNQLAFVAGAAALDQYWSDATFSLEVRRKEAMLRAHFLDRIQLHEPDADFRGKGLLFGLDLTAVGGSERAQRIARSCFDDGLIIERCGRGDAVLKILPPLTISEEDIIKGIDILATAIQNN